VSDVPTCGGVAYAQAHGIATLTYPASKRGAFPGLGAQELADALQAAGVDIVVLAGFLKVAAWRRAGDACARRVCRPCS
jgi:folate-dependent phosphoribosylglycinamide formyltransferase PurN